MLQKSLTCAILFVDISGSTNLYESLGNTGALKLVNSCISVLSGIVGDHHGTIINTIGDEVMCSFPSAAQAVDAAIVIQKSLDSMCLNLPDKRILVNIRIGIHWGDVIKQNYDMFGDAVSVASHLVAIAKPMQIITTAPTIDALPAGSGFDARRIERTTVRGKGGEFAVYEIVWQEPDDTMTFSSVETMPVIFCRLHLKHGDTELYVDSDKPFVTLGRQKQNDLVINDVIASRQHARIESRRGKFVLIDQSTNGTYVSQEGKTPLFVHSDEITLSSHGIISLGREAQPHSEEAIYFTYEYQNAGSKAKDGELSSSG